MSWIRPFDPTLSEEFAAINRCDHGKLWVMTVCGKTCSQCGLTEWEGIYPGYFRVPFAERANHLLK